MSSSGRESPLSQLVVVFASMSGRLGMPKMVIMWSGSWRGADYEMNAWVADAIV